MRTSIIPLALALGACAAQPPRECEADSDCSQGQVCLRESPLVPADIFAAQNRRDPKTVCQAVKPRPNLPLRDASLHAGAAKVDITPRGFETHTNIEDSQNCPRNKPFLFEGYFDAPRGKDDPNGDPQNPCLETFNDANGNGLFDAVWIGGFDNARAAQGIDEEVPIMARVLAVAYQGEYFVIIAMDFIGILPGQQEEMRKILATELGLDRNRVIVHVTHNHESPDIQGIWGPTVVNSGNGVAKAIVEIAGDDLGTFSEIPVRPGMPQSYWQTVETKVLEATRAALASMKPARMKFVAVPAPMQSRPVQVGGQPVNVDSVLFDKDNVQLPDFNGDGVTNDNDDVGRFQSGGAGRLLMTDIKLPHIMDPTVVAVQLTDAGGGATIATLVNWTNHVEALGDENVMLSADYAGFLCNLVEKKLGGVAVYTVGTVGGLQTQLRDCWVPRMDAEGRFLDAQGQVVASMDLAGKAENNSREKAAGLGRAIARTAVEALEGAPFVTPPKLRVSARYAWLPLDNPFFYIGGRLGILPGVIDWFTGKRRTDQFTLSTKAPSCGGVGCLRADILLVDLGPLRIVTAPGELYPEYVVGRKASTFHFGGTRNDAYRDLDEDGIPDETDPEILVRANVDPSTSIRVPYKFPANPQKFMAIEGLRPVDRDRNGTQVLMMIGEANNAIGYLIPESDILNRYEGFLEGVEDYTSVLGRADLRAMLDLRIPEEVLLGEFIDDLRRRFAPILADIPGLYLEDHVNQVGDENSTGPRNGNIVYNTMCELLNGGSCPTKLPVSPDPNDSLPRQP
jgi:hypothetical protein